MKKFIPRAIILGLTGMATLTMAVSVTHAASHQQAITQAHKHAKVDMTEVDQKYTFQPTTLTIKVGTTVTFTNSSDALHSVTFTKGGTFDKDVAAGQRLSHTFKKVATITYYCKYHPYMKATIVVKK